MLGGRSDQVLRGDTARHSGWCDAAYRSTVSPRSCRGSTRSDRAGGARPRRRSDSTRHRKVIENYGQPFQDVPIQLGHPPEVDDHRQAPHVDVARVDRHGRGLPAGAPVSAPAPLRAASPAGAETPLIEREVLLRRSSPGVVPRRLPARAGPRPISGGSECSRTWVPTASLRFGARPGREGSRYTTSPWRSCIRCASSNLPRRRNT